MLAHLGGLAVVVEEYCIRREQLEQEGQVAGVREVLGTLAYPMVLMEWIIQVAEVERVD